MGLGDPQLARSLGFVTRVGNATCEPKNPPLHFVLLALGPWMRASCDFYGSLALLSFCARLRARPRQLGERETELVELLVAELEGWEAGRSHKCSDASCG